MHTDETARIFDVQRLTIHDGPGLRTTVFFKGCPLACTWCQNPESISPQPEILFDQTRCIGCGACQPPQCGRSLCRGCGDCAEVCPTGARSLAGQEIRIPDLLDRLLRDQAFYANGGGVTFSGGEPLAQWPAIRKLAHSLRAHGVHIALDTSGVASEEIHTQVLEEIDLIIVDLKLMDPDKHRQWTGQGNARILSAIQYWNRHIPERLWISLPLIPGVHTEDDIRDSVAFLSGLPNAVQVRLIPWHPLGYSKYEQLSRQAPQFSGDVNALTAFTETCLKHAEIPVLPPP